MANFHINEIVLLFVTWIAYSQASSWLKWRELKKWGANQGCEDVPVVPNKLPGGIERFAIIVCRMVSGGLKSTYSKPFFLVVTINKSYAHGIQISISSKT